MSHGIVKQSVSPHATVPAEQLFPTTNNSTLHDIDHRSGPIPKAVVTIGLLIVMFFLAVGFAKLAQCIYKNRQIPDDVSEHTKDLLSKQQELRAKHIKRMKARQQQQRELHNQTNSV